ncbi:MAG TPA: hypothetical protein VE378_04400 [Nitrososphaeraceae archaeon]|nr:hypothetical protein [Nitrososphaeraceae archaeon]
MDSNMDEFKARQLSIPSSVGWSSSSIHLVDVPSRGRQIIRRFHLKMEEEDLQQPIPYSQ